MRPIRSKSPVDDESEEQSDSDLEDDTEETPSESDDSERVDSQESCDPDPGPSAGLTEQCCPDHGVDACGAGLFCEAFDGRSIYTCYAERTRLDLEECSEGRQCASGSCNEDERACRSQPGMDCDIDIGCSEEIIDATFVCQNNATCERVWGESDIGEPCAEDSDCLTGYGLTCSDAFECERDPEAQAAYCEDESDCTMPRNTCISVEDLSQDVTRRCVELSADGQCSQAGAMTAITPVVGFICYQPCPSTEVCEDGTTCVPIPTINGGEVIGCL